MLKKNMLHHRWITLVVIFQLVFIWCLPVNAYAAEYPKAPLDYKTLDYTVKEGALYNTVSVPLSSKHFTMEVFTSSNAIVTRYQGHNAMTFPMNAGTRYNIFVYPVSNYGLLIDDIPEGSYISFDLTVGYFTNENFYVPSWAKRSYYLDKNHSWVSSVLTENINADFDKPINVTYEISDIPSSAISFVPSVKLANIGTALATGSNDFQVSLSNVQLVMEISTGHWEQWLAEQTGQMISEATDAITGAIGDAGESIVSSVEAWGLTINDSLDIVNSSIGTMSEDVQDSIGDMSFDIQDSLSIVGDKIDQNSITIIEGNEYTNHIANESNDQMSAASGKLDDLGDQLNSVEKPSADSMNVSADELFGGMAATSMLTAPVLEIWKNPVALSILTVVVTIVLISWVFFGKK